MPALQTIITMPGTPDHHRFEEVVANCYEPGGPRERGGHELDAGKVTACVVVLRNNLPVGRCAFYFDQGLAGEAVRTASVGSYECVNDRDVARAIFDEVRSLARKYRIARLIGPMEGSTWNSYRFSDTDDRPRFFTEPYHHPYYPGQWKEEGFVPLARYVSRMDRDLVVDQLAIRFKDEDLANVGISIRPLNKARLVQELALIGQFSIEAFAGNFLYTPITVEEFVMKYHRLGQLLVPRLVLIAVDRKEALQGFILGLPDMFSPDRTTLVVKSAARRKDAPSGLGTHLLRKLEQSAVELGFTSAIHAFMHEDNASARRSAITFGAEPFGSYTLFEQRLDGR